MSRWPECATTAGAPMGYFQRKIDRARCRLVVRTSNAAASDLDVWTAVPACPPRRGRYVRFSRPEPHPLSGRRSGIFVVTHALLRRKSLDAHVAEGLDSCVDWFNENLRSPDFDEARAIFLFKPDAVACLERIWHLIAYLRQAGIPIEMQSVRKPGRIVYEDEHQVAALPFADSGRL